jgi:oligoribonuclease
MIYISIDIETSGLNPDSNHVLSIGAIIEDTTKKLPYEDLPKFNAVVLQHNIQGSPRAITMNKEIISMMGDYLEGTDEVREILNNNSGYKFYTEDEVAKEFYYFLDENGFSQGLHNNSGGYVEIKDGKHRPAMNNGTKPITINVAGKNFGTFDKLFLEELPWWKKLIRTRSRIIDPSILFCDWNEDNALPSLIKCKERANIEGIVTHNALEDAWDVIELLRKNY